MYRFLLKFLYSLDNIRYEEEEENLKFEDVFKVSILNFVYCTLARENPTVFWEWFTYSHLIHNHATTSSTHVIRNNYFDVGSVVNTRFLFTKRSHLLNYGGKMIQVGIWTNIMEHPPHGNP